MNRVHLFTTVVVSSLCLGLVSRAADTAAFIAKARASLGTEAALSALTSVHYIGVLETVDDRAEGKPKPIKYGIDMIYQKPYRQRIEVKADQSIETTALDDYDGWQRKQNPAVPNDWSMFLLAKDQVKRLRANTWEAFAYYRGLEQRGGQTEDQGEVQVDGKRYRKITYTHEPGISFVRYFDPSTGRLLLTETDQSAKIREEGEVVVNGVRFPKKIVSTNKLANGKDRVVTVTFDKILVNEKLSDDLFRVPLMPPK